MKKIILRASNSLINKKKAYFSVMINSTEARKLDNPIFIDLRHKYAYNDSHITNAVSAFRFYNYLYESKKKELQELKDAFQPYIHSKGITGKENLVFYEDHLLTQKGASSRGYYLMKFFGYDTNKLFILKDGFRGWNKVNSELVESGEEKEIANIGNFEINFETKFFIDYKELKQKIEEGKTNVVDVRDYEEYKGYKSTPYEKDFAPIKGRLPNTKFILWSKFMDDMGEDYESNERIESLIKKAGINNKDDEIIVYCFNGSRSSVAFVALEKAGYKNVRNYLGSWNEWSKIGGAWSSEEKLPIDSKIIEENL